MKRYNFDRYFGGRIMAEGIGVHAETMGEALAKANQMNGNGTTRLKFRDNRPCAFSVKLPCRYCYPMEEPTPCAP